MWSRNRKKFTEKQLSSLHKKSQQTVISHKSVGSERSDSARKTGSCHLTNSLKETKPNRHYFCIPRMAYLLHQF